MELDRTFNYSKTNISKTLCPPKIENGNFISIVSQYESQMKNNFKADQIPLEQNNIFKNNDFIHQGGNQIRFNQNDEEMQDSDVEMQDESKIVEITASGNVEIKNNKCFLNKNENNIKFEENNNYLDFDNKAESISMTNNEILINNSSNNKNYDFMLQDNPINMNDECYLSKWRKLYDSVRDNNNRLMKKNILSILERLIFAKKINEKNRKIEIVEINYNDDQNNKKIKSRNENSNSIKSNIKDSIDSRTSYDNLTRIITTTEIKNLSNSINSSINSNLIIQLPRFDEDEDIKKVQNNYQETDISKILIPNNIFNHDKFQSLVDFLEYKDELYMKKLKNDSSNVRISLDTSMKKKDYGNIFTINEEDNESYDSLSLSKSIKNNSKKVTPSKLNIKKNTFKEIQDMFSNPNNDNDDNLDKFYNHKEIQDINIDNANQKNKKIEEIEIGNNDDDDIEDNEDNEDIIINDIDNDLNTNINYNIKNNNKNEKKILSIDLDKNLNNINNTNNNDNIKEDKKDNIFRESDENIEQNKHKHNDKKGNEDRKKVEDENNIKIGEEKNEKIIIKMHENEESLKDKENIKNEEKDYFIQKPILVKSNKNNNTSNKNIDINTNKLEYKNNKNNNINNDFEINNDNNYNEKDKDKDKDNNINEKEKYNINNTGYINNFKKENEVQDINANNNFNDNNISINKETHADDKNNKNIISDKSSKSKINDSNNNLNIEKINEKIVLSPSIIQNNKSDSFSDLIISPKSNINTKSNKKKRRNERNKNNNNENQIYDLYSNHISLSSNLSDGTRQNLFEIFSSFKIIDQKNRKILFLRNDYGNDNNNIYNKKHIYEIPLFSYYYILQLFIGKKIGLNGSYEIFIKKLMYKLEKDKMQNLDKIKNKNNKINNQINSEIYNFEQKLKNLRMTYKNLIEKRSLLKTRKEKEQLMKEVDIIKNQNDTKQMFLKLLFLIENDSYNENKYNSYKEKIMNILKRYCKINKSQNYKDQIKYKHKKLSQPLKDNKSKYEEDENSGDKNMKNIKNITNKKIFFMFSFMIPLFYIIDYISRYSKITE